MIDLYEVLGVTRLASQKEIKQAYRKLAQANHPDKGGDDEAFREIQEAYEVLKDPERRERYDATGDTAPVKDPSEDMITRLFQVIIQKKDYSGDLIETCRNSLSTEHAKLLRGTKELKAELSSLQELQARVTTTSETNLFAEAIRQQCHVLEQQLNNLAEQGLYLDKVAEMLKAYTDDAPEPKAESYQPYFNRTGSTTGRF